MCVAGDETSFRCSFSSPLASPSQSTHRGFPLVCGDRNRVSRKTPSHSVFLFLLSSLFLSLPTLFFLPYLPHLLFFSVEIGFGSDYTLWDPTLSRDSLVESLRQICFVFRLPRELCICPVRGDRSGVSRVRHPCPRSAAPFLQSCDKSS